MLDSGRSLPSEMPLVVTSSPVVFEPVDQHLEGSVVCLMEVETTRSHLDELFEDSLLGDVTKHDVLGIAWKDRESVRDSTRVLLLLLFETSFEIFKGLGIRELLVANDLTDKSVAGNDVALNDFSQTFKLVVVADSEDTADCCSRSLVTLMDVDVNVVVLPELPSQSDPVFTAC